MTTLCFKCGLACGEAEYVVHIANNCQTVKCPHCPQFYNNAEGLLRHTRAVHDKEFQCSICSLGYASKYNLKRHLATTHKQIDNEKINKIAKCEQCGEIFIGKYFLKRHIQHVHNKEFVCTICNTEYTSIYTLKRHRERTHPSEEEDAIEKVKVAKINCPKCSKPIAKSSLERHLRIKHRISLICHVCDKECRSEKSLQHHIDSRHGEENSVEVLLKKKYKCPHCPRRFTAGWTLKTHIRGKHEQQFKCELCDKYFSAPFPLFRHKANIHGIKMENESTSTTSKTTEDDFDVKEESDEEDDDEGEEDESDEVEEDEEIPSTSQKIKTENEIEKQKEEDQVPTHEELKSITIKKEEL